MQRHAGCTRQRHTGSTSRSKNFYKVSAFLTDVSYKRHPCVLIKRLNYQGNGNPKWPWRSWVWLPDAVCVPAGLCKDPVCIMLLARLCLKWCAEEILDRTITHVPRLFDLLSYILRFSHRLRGKRILRLRWSGANCFSFRSFDLFLLNDAIVLFYKRKN